ncbi:MAG: NUDIX domain-containing protein [Bacteroidetes bacterium]|jgi:8-oxo-dGTP pyrophosphatase MutT (NUDIX family)|nr:NUDIX domain-containing protein [Bacteroidota bacterium]
MATHPFHQFLVKRSRKELPGREAQLKMSPEPLDPDFVLPQKKSDTAHPSSVLIPLFPDHENQLQVILTLRTDSIRHAGQISFPGGRQEGSETPEETALRETEEEIGVVRNKVQIACSITPLYLHRTDNQITPYVGFLEEEPELIPDPAEVQEAFSIPVQNLMNGENFKKEEWDLAHSSFHVPFWTIHEVPLWGATAMMMSELLELYKEFVK